MLFNLLMCRKYLVVNEFTFTKCYSLFRTIEYGDMLKELTLEYRDMKLHCLVSHHCAKITIHSSRNIYTLYLVEYILFFVKAMCSAMVILFCFCII